MMYGSLVICHWLELDVSRCFWVITSDPRYPGYKTLTVAPEPFVERVVRAVRSMEGKIGTHMILWVPLRDSEV
jgi:hypothetical protein